MLRSTLLMRTFVCFLLLAHLNGIPIINQRYWKKKLAPKSPSPLSITSLHPEAAQLSQPKKKPLASDKVIAEVISSTTLEHWTPMKQIGTKEGSSSAVWTYENPDAWPSVNPTCGGLNQSPIDIHPKTSVLKSYPKLRFGEYGDVDNIKVVNNGHTVLFHLSDDYPRIPFVSGGGLNEAYDFVQFHLHWGSDSTKGSEHRIKSKSYAAELHLVHYNTKYESFAKAVHHSDGLAVLAVFIDVSREDNRSLEPLVAQLDEVHEGNNHETTLTRLVPFHALLPKETSSFFLYSGSLTTPACDQVVIWTVFNNPIYMSEKQLSKFRKLATVDGRDLVNNFRTPLSLNSRRVTYRSFSSCETSEPGPFTSSPILQVLIWGQCLMSSSLRSFFSF